MVRLTDLIGTGDRKRQQSPSSLKPLVPDRNKSAGNQEYLQASDLESLYGIPERPDRRENNDESTSETAEKAMFSAVDQQPSRQTPEFRETSTVPQGKQPVPNAQYQPEALEQPDQFVSFGNPPSPKEQLPGTPAYHKDAAPQTFTASDDRRFQEEADAIHIELLDLLDDIYSEGRDNKVLTVERLVDPVIRLINVCRSSNVILRKAVRLKKGGETLTTHSLNVATLGIKIGISRGYTQEKLFSLAVCALLGDIGMTRVSPAILNKKGKLEPEEFQEIKNHVEYSREICQQIGNKFPFLAPIVYQIHERENGNGYPEGLRGGNIHEFAKIIGMCDVYIAMTSPKSHRTDFSGYETLQQIISRRGIDFNAIIIKSLIDVISVFPLESLVKLNNGSIGRVIDISSVHPTRPKLLILVNSEGERLKTGKIMDLEREPLLYIEDPDIEEGAIL
jgi:HD-GYP domain-containing protein (c-di-GMP phosphodiesterase class II)